MSHLTSSQRYTISSMLEAGHSRKAICLAIGKDKSVLSRELKRNSDQRSGKYRADLAERKCTHRHKTKTKCRRFSAEIQAHVETQLSAKLSPEQIVGQADCQQIACVSIERIYQHIWSDKRKGGDLYTHLRSRGKRYRKRGADKDKRGIIKDRVDISERPAVVEEKKRLGDLEIDTIIGAGKKGAILTINDRVSGMVRIKKLNGKDAKELAQTVIEILQSWKEWLHTITADNRKEFAEHKIISNALNIGFYFAQPYHSWERGANENLNGLIRQFIPKKTNFETLTDEYIQWVEDQLNNRPRKRFNFASPIQVFNQKKVAFIT